MPFAFPRRRAMRQSGIRRSPLSRRMPAPAPTGHYPMDTTRTRYPAPIDTAMRRHLSTLVIGLTAFLTVVDLFATQAILPTLVRAYGVTPAAMGVAVNASTFGMAASGLVMALISRNIDR